MKPWSAMFRYLATQEEDNPRKMLPLLVKENIYSRTCNDSTLLHFAVLQDRPMITHTLIQSGAEVRETNIEGESALHWACKSGFIRCCLILIINGADINLQDNEGNTPLHWAYEAEQPEIIQLLLGNGCRTDIPNEDGKLPSEVADEEFHKIAYELIECTNLKKQEKNINDSYCTSIVDSTPSGVVFAPAQRTLSLHQY